MNETYLAPGLNHDTRRWKRLGCEGCWPDWIIGAKSGHATVKYKWCNTCCQHGEVWGLIDHEEPVKSHLHSEMTDS